MIIALVVHDVLEGEPVDGIRPGWTHYTALLSPQGDLLREGCTDEDQPGWVGPYPVERGEYHCTGYFLGRDIAEKNFTRGAILKAFEKYGLGSVNIIGKYTNPKSD